jgi:hypothetical protein
VGGILSTPDMPVSLLFLLALALAIHSARRWSAIAFFFTGVVVAFAILSKFNGFASIPILALYWLITSSDRPRRARLLPLIAVAGLVALIPYLIWNSTHDWITFRYLFWYRHEDSGKVLINWIGPLSLLGNLFTLGPIMTLLVLGAIYQRIRFFRQENTKERKSAELTMFLLPLAGLVLLSFKISSAPHWIGQILLTGTIVTVGAWCDWRASPGSPSWGPGHRILIFSAFINIIICLLLYISVLNISVLYRLASAVGLSLPYENVVEFFGWDQFAQQLNKELDEIEKEGEPVFILAPEHRLASLARFYAKKPHHAAVLREVDQQQFTFWPKPADMPHSNALYVDKKLRKYREVILQKQYNSVSPHKTLSVEIFDGYRRSFFFWQVRDRKD